MNRALPGDFDTIMRPITGVLNEDAYGVTSLPVIELQTRRAGGFSAVPSTRQRLGC